MKHSKILLGLVIAFTVGFGCRWLGIPSPAPPVLSGAALVFMMSLGYYLADRFWATKPAEHKKDCGGPEIT